MIDAQSNPEQDARTPRLSRRDGMRLVGAGAHLSLLGRGWAPAVAQDASPVASADAGCIADPAANSATAARWFTEVLDQQKLDILEEIVDPDMNLDPGAFSGMTGAEQVNQMLGGLLGAFPDASYTIEDTLADGDRVVIRWTATGTHAGDYAGIAATGEPRRWSGIHFFRFACGRIADLRVEADILAQLGLVDDVHATPVPFTGGGGGPGPACETPSRGEMERFANAWQDVWDSHDVTTYEGVVSPDAVHHFGVRSDAVGLPAIQNGLTGFFTAFPDLKGPSRISWSMATRWHSATPTAARIPADSRRSPDRQSSLLDGMTILRVSCGLIVESWAQVDGLSLGGNSVSWRIQEPPHPHNLSLRTPGDSRKRT